jgi:hypothetical protein
MTTRSLPLLSVVPGAMDSPSFATPVFGSGPADCYLQVVKDGREIIGFEKLSYLDPNLSRMQTQIRATVGESPVFAFRFNSNDVLCAPREQLARRLRQRFDELKDFPFSKLSVTSFLDDRTKIRRAETAAKAELGVLNPDLAASWFLGQTRRGKKQSYRDPTDWHEIREFTLALLKFCRAQRKLSHNSFHSRRLWARSEYDVAFERVVSFLVDAGFLGVLRQKLQDIEKSPTQFELSFVGVRDERLRSMTRLGVSRKTAHELLDHIKRGAKRDDSRYRNANEVLILLLRVDGSIRSEIELSQKLARAEKKIKKKQLEVGAISIAYGLVLLLRSYAGQTNLVGENLDELAIAALRAGLKNCAPPDRVRKEGWEFQTLFNLARQKS